MKHYERLSLQFQGQLAGGSTWWEPPSKKGALERLMADAGEEAKVLDVGEQHAQSLYFSKPSQPRTKLIYITSSTQDAV